MDIGLWGRKKNEARAMTDEIERVTSGDQSAVSGGMIVNDATVNQAGISINMGGGLNSGETSNADTNSAERVTGGLRHNAFQGIGNVALGEMKNLEYGGGMQNIGGVDSLDERVQNSDRVRNGGVSSVEERVQASDLPNVGNFSNGQQSGGWMRANSTDSRGVEGLEEPLENRERMQASAMDSAGVFEGGLQGEKQAREVSLGGNNESFGERRAIFGTEQMAGDMPARGEGQDLKVAESNARVKEMVAIENGYAQNGLEAGANVVGGESKKEIQERLKDDREDLKVESGDGWEHNLLTKSQEGLTKEAVQQIDKIIKNNSYRPADLERERFLGMAAILRTYGRKFGERN